MKNMKKLSLVLFLAITLTNCTVDKTKIVEDVIENINSKNYKESSKYLAEDFKYIKFNSDSIYDKTYFMEVFNKPSIKGNNFIYNIVDIEETDSTVSTKEEQYRPWDTILQVGTYTEVRKTYYFTGEKINKIIIDSILNEEKYVEEFNELISPVNEFIEEKYGNEIEELKGKVRLDYLYENVLSYFIEYSKLSDEEKNEYKISSYLKGTFTCKGGIYAKLVFKGKSTVVIYDGFIGIPFPTSYVIDENYIRIRTDKSDLLLKIKDSKTLEGEGWAKGTYIKQL
jgi:hypothetical protein